MKKQNWIWMPHAGHLIVGNECRFCLNTYIGKFIISTVGEYWPDQQVRRIHAKINNSIWYSKHESLKGDNFDFEYMKEFGFSDIGADRKYETMVFKAKKSKDKCCPYTQINGEDVDFQSYNKAEDAFNGHIKMCLKWSKK